MQPSEPKPIVSIMRVLDKICRDPDLIVKHGRTMDLLSSHFSHSSNVPISQSDIGVRARLLQFYSLQALHGGNA